MTPIQTALSRLRQADAPLTDADDPVAREVHATGIRFVALGGGLEQRWQQAWRELRACIAPIGSSAPLLHEGGVYHGAWLESTATINAEMLDRFAPSVTRATHLAFADAQRSDGLLPYKVTADGPAFTQIQTVTPLARCVWNHYLLTGRDRDYLARMHDAMVRNDAWLAAHRDTRGTGGVEAFCTYDTGHDLSPRFWHMPERCHRGDATAFDPGVPLLPVVAPDLTANVACQREYLALIAAELGEDAAPWREKAAASRAALHAQCHVDGMFYDRAAGGSHVRVDSDVLLRVLACEIGDDDVFAAALEDHLMNTRRFLSLAGFTSIAMDDPRFDGDHTRNSWAGPVNALTLLRAAHAFEHHGRVAELALTHAPLLAAMAGHDRFAQCYDPTTADAGYTEVYSPSILWLLDTLERDAGILPRPDGEVWLSGLTPTRLAHGQAATATGAARTVAGVHYELVGDDEAIEVHRDGVRWLQFPRGWRVVLGADGEPAAVVGLAVVGLAAGPVAGILHVGDDEVPLTLAPNERVALAGGRLGARTAPGFTPPRF
ncbi:hypothetical protein NQ156_04520 [Microbacterium sp. zg.Y625]|uniref:MGH1-like glycoside hydrolase domain-containing protein n=1 Tax=Microbacterium jiangjiandongii TaxID=3049071 RepID=UPI00214BDA38|nr:MULTISPECIES: hypothetical protein [unclassified Microbacterium]MCR2792323.1 hypothetical protein [Microbacterium sp. zg.Y625]WIM25118.1 hypothetical protein QNO14_13425 [Microbacterium sp. zg-Y625]